MSYHLQHDDTLTIKMMTAPLVDLCVLNHGSNRVKKITSDASAGERGERGHCFLWPTLVGHCMVLYGMKLCILVWYGAEYGMASGNCKE